MRMLWQLATTSLVFSASLMTAACETTGADPSDDYAGEPGTSVAVSALSEAPTGFDGLSNGFSTQADMDAAAAVFAEVEGVADGLGPVYNRQSCAECHHVPVLGGTSDVRETRVGTFDGTRFIDPPGGSLIQDRAIDPAIQETVPPGNARTFRVSLSMFGDGYVEAINNSTLTAIAAAQPAAQRGTVIQVPVLEAPGAVRAGRFGWKDQNASVLSVVAEEYLDEIGITSPLKPVENTSNGRSVADFDRVPDPEDDGSNTASLALFVRSLKAPPVDAARAASASAVRGSNAFNQIGCAVCHTRTIATAPVGTVINGGAFTVPAALGDKSIHPLCDFLLHNVGTGDGIVQNGGVATRNQVRTACLWGLRTRTQFMHDGTSPTVTQAIQRHGGQATAARNSFNALSAASRTDLLNFLLSL